MAGISGTPQLKSDDPLWTRPVIQNNTGSNGKLFQQSNRNGYGPAPETIGAHLTSEYSHTADNTGSFGGVAYQIVNGGSIWIIAWKNVVNDNNKVYTKILKPGEEFNWDVFFRNLEILNRNTSNDKHAGLLATVVIDLLSGTPTLTAVLSPQ